MSDRIKLLFVGAGWEAYETLEALYSDKRFEIVGILTQPDRPKGRKREIKKSKIVKFSEIEEIPLFYADKDNVFKQTLESCSPEIIVCKSFGVMLPEFFLEAAKFKAINVHYSLLPKYRGAVPVQKAILEGERRTGLSIVRMVKKLDAGDILAQYGVEIADNDTNVTIRKKLVEVTKDRLADILVRWCAGKITPVKQDESMASYCWESDIAKKNAFVDFERMSAVEIDRMVRAFLPWPVAWFLINSKRMKIFEASIVDVESMDDEFIMKCKEGYLKLDKVQLEGKGIIDGRELKNYTAIRSVLEQT